MTSHYRGLDVGLSPQSMGSFAEPATVKLYYVTNRAPSRASIQEPFYGPDLSRSGQLYGGTIEAQVPRDERVGGRQILDVSQGAFRTASGVKIKKPIRRLPPPSDQAENLDVVSISVVSQDPPAARDLSEFVKQIKAENPPDKPILLYLHGFNNTFPSVVKRAARFTYDLGGTEQFVPIIFSWPAFGSIEAVTRDENNVGPSAVPLAQLLRLLLEGDDARTVHMVVHSMGTRIISQAMLRLAGEQPPGRKLKNLVITAGDMDAVEFAMPEQVNVLKAHSELISIYICDHDVALYGSMYLHGPSSPPDRRRPRIGQAGRHRTVINDSQFETIDATLVELSAENHAYLFENRLVLDDVFMLLRHGLPAAKRNLLVATEGESHFYLLRR